jgi:multiple sugar transport system permease protein
MRLGRLGLYGAAFLSCAILGFPIYWMFNTSISPRDELYVYPPTIIHPHPTADAYLNIFTSRPIGQWLVNSLLVVGATTLVAVLTATWAAYSLSRFRPRGSATLAYLILATRLLPATTLIIPLFILMRTLGLIDNLASLVLADSTVVIPFAVWMLKGYFDSIPRELEDAALVDGTGYLGALFRITVPLAAPGIVATMLYSAILTWDEYLFARTFLNQAANWTISLGLASFRGEYVTYWNDVMAASLIGTVPIIALFLVLERHMVSGITGGAVK